MCCKREFSYPVLWVNEDFLLMLDEQNHEETDSVWQVVLIIRI